MRTNQLVLLLFLAGCGNPAAGDLGYSVETLRARGPLAYHDAQLAFYDLSVAMTPIDMNTRKDVNNQHFLNVCNPLSPEGAEAAAAANAAGGSVDVAAPQVGLQAGASGDYRNSGLRLVTERRWNKTQGALIFESYRFALCEAWRNKQLDNQPLTAREIVDTLTSAYEKALAAASAEVATDGWAKRNEGIVKVEYPSAPTINIDKAEHGTFNNTPIPLPTIKKPEDTKPPEQPSSSADDDADPASPEG